MDQVESLWEEGLLVRIPMVERATKRKGGGGGATARYGRHGNATDV